MRIVCKECIALYFITQSEIIKYHEIKEYIICDFPLKGEYANIQSQQISLIRRRKWNKPFTRLSRRLQSRKIFGENRRMQLFVLILSIPQYATRPRRCACIRDFIQPCEGPSVAGGGTNGTSAGGPGPSPNTTTLHHITQRTPACTYYPYRRHWLDMRSTTHFTFYAL